MLLVKIRPIKYIKHNIIMEEINEIMLPEEFKTNISYKYFDIKPAAAPAATGLKIQFEISKTMHDICKSLVRYNIVLRIVVMNRANKYALNPYTGMKK